MNNLLSFFIDYVLKYIGYVFAIVGFVGTIHKTYTNWRDLKVVSWKDVKKYTNILLKKMYVDGFVPDYIVGIGRSGAIIGALISGNIQIENKKANIPIIACDRFFEWTENGREEIDDNIIDFFPLKDKKILLVCGDVSTGGTIKHFRKKLFEIQPQELKTAVMIKVKTATFHPNYYAKELLGDFGFPWVIKKRNYKRDGRSKAGT